MSKTPLAAAADHGHEHHVHPVSMYLKTALVLGLLMALTVGISYVNLPGGVVVNNIVAVSIAVFKTIIVVLFFMHVKWSTKLTKLWAFAGFGYLAVLATILIDYGFRAHEPVPSWYGKTGPNNEAIRETALPRKIGSTDNIPLQPIELDVQNRLPKGTL